MEAERWLDSKKINPAPPPPPPPTTTTTTATTTTTNLQDCQPWNHGFRDGWIVRWLPQCLQQFWDLSLGPKDFLCPVHCVPCLISFFLFEAAFWMVFWKPLNFNEFQIVYYHLLPVQPHQGNLLQRILWKQTQFILSIFDRFAGTWWNVCIERGIMDCNLPEMLD